MNFENLSKETIALLAKGSVATYATIAIVVVMFGVLNVLNAIPFVEPALELAGLFYLYTNRQELLAKVLPSVIEITDQIAAALPESTQDDVL